MAHSNALVVNGEIAAVIAAMRSNLKWSAARTYMEEELEDPIIERLKNLRRAIFTWQDWQVVEPSNYLTPFLQVIKSPETSGPITGVALSSVHKFLTSDIIGDSIVGVPDAIRAICDAVTQCKFEATYPASDECVLSKILDVLVACVTSPHGQYLSNDNVINIFQACYRIGHYQTEKGRDTSELLTQASRRALIDLVRIMFSRLESVPGSAGSAHSTIFSHTTGRLQVSPLGPTPVPSSPTVLSPTGNAGAASTFQPNGAVEEAEARLNSTTTTVDEQQPVSSSIQGPSAAVVVEKTADAVDTTGGAQENNTTTAAAVEDGNTQQDESAPLLQPRSTHEIVSLLPPIATQVPEQTGPESEAGAGGDSGYGSEAIREVLYFVIDLIQTAPTSKDRELSAHGLDLMCTALQAAGPTIQEHEHLMALVQENLIKALFAAGSGRPTLACLAGICQVALGLYVHLSHHLLLQLEAIVGLLLLPIAEGRNNATVEQQQVALEGILDFCAQPGFVRDIYINTDCRIERSNLYEGICALLSKAAFPVNGPLAPVHLVSLDGIVSILAALCDGCVGSSVEEEHLAPLSDPEQYIDIWTALCAGTTPPAVEALGLKGHSVADLARAEKFLKGRLAAAAEHFNRDQKKGFQYLQGMKLLPQTLEPVSVARFLRGCPGLAKAGIGEILGERDAFYEGVRDAFIETFAFAGLDFDMALRLFMDSFRPPGEGQKIDRIMQVFGRRYYEQMPASGLKSVDAAYVLAFSVIMLNTDLHNTQNRKKMSLEDFARINRSTNEGEPMPQKLLEQIYGAIASDELKISTECLPEELPRQLVFWMELAREAQRPRGKMVRSPETNAGLEKEMFSLIWGPTLAAVSVILDNTSDPGTVRRAMAGLISAAQLAAYYKVDDVVDQIVVGLSKYCLGALTPNPASKVLPAQTFGESPKAQAALETMFAIANRHGDWLRSGWRSILDCIVRLHRIGLLPPAVIAADYEDAEEANARMPRPTNNKTKGSTGSLFSRAINSLISIEGPDPSIAEQAAAREETAASAAVKSVAACRIEDVFADSKFLTAESLVELVKATMWAAGNVVAAVSTGEDTETAELCLELLIALVLRNRDRAALIWPLVHEYLAACTSAENVEESNALVERAVIGLLRVSQRLLPYKEDSAEELLASLRLITGLNGRVAWALSDRIASELLILLKSSAPYVRTEADWRTVCSVIRLTAVKPDAAPVAFEALAAVCRDPAAIGPESYMPLMETCLQLIDKYKGNNADVAVRFLDMIEALFMWLVDQGRLIAAPVEGKTTRLTYATLVDLWLTTLGALAKGLCRDTCRPLRDTSLAVLHRAVTASSALQLPGDVWVQTTGELLVPLVSDLADGAAGRSRGGLAGLDKSVRLASNLLTKSLLQYVGTMSGDKDFYTLWGSALGALQDCMAVRSEAVIESVPENVKNMILVLAGTGILTPDWRDVSGRSLWELTWSKVAGISSGLNPQMLDAAGVGSAPPPPPPPPVVNAPSSPKAAAEPESQATTAGAVTEGDAQTQAPVAESNPAEANANAVAAVEGQQQVQQQEQQQEPVVAAAPVAVAPQANGGTESLEEGYEEAQQAEQAGSTCKQS